MFTKTHETYEIAFSAPLTAYFSDVKPFLLLYREGRREIATAGLHRYLRHVSLRYCKRLMEELYHEFKHTLDQ